MTKKAASKSTKATPKPKVEEPQEQPPQKEQPNPGKLAMAYDATRDILTIEGVQYSGELFRSLGGLPVSPEALYRIRPREYGEGKLLELTTVPDQAVRAALDKARLVIARAFDKKAITPDGLTAAMDEVVNDIRITLRMRP